MNLTETGKLGGAQGSLGLGLERQGRKRKKELTERGRGMANSWRCEKCREKEKRGKTVRVPSGLLRLLATHLHIFNLAYSCPHTFP